MKGYTCACGANSLPPATIPFSGLDLGEETLPGRMDEDLSAQREDERYASSRTYRESSGKARVVPRYCVTTWQHTTDMWQHTAEESQGARNVL